MLTDTILEVGFEGGGVVDELPDIVVFIPFLFLALIVFGDHDGFESQLVAFGEMVVFGAVVVNGLEDDTLVFELFRKPLLHGLKGEGFDFFAGDAADVRCEVGDQDVVVLVAGVWGVLGLFGRWREMLLRLFPGPFPDSGNDQDKGGNPNDSLARFLHRRKGLVFLKKLL